MIYLWIGIAFLVGLAWGSLSSRLRVRMQCGPNLFVEAATVKEARLMLEEMDKMFERQAQRNASAGASATNKGPDPSEWRRPYQ